MTRKLELLKKVIQAHCRDRRIVIYGMGKVGSKIYDEFKKNYNLICTDRFNSKYQSPDFLRNGASNYFVIITPLKGYTEIEDKLNQFGFNQGDYVSCGKLRKEAEEYIYDLNSFNGFIGDFCDYGEAVKYICNNLGYTEGYSNINIADSVVEATSKVIKGEAVYERDSVCFYKKQWNFQVLTSIFYVKENTDKLINIIDFGGALGSFYYQHKKLFNNKEINYCVIEQESFITAGRELSEEVQFFNNIKESIDKNKTNIVILSSVLMYLEEPYRIIEDIINNNIDYIILDRNYYNTYSNDRLCVQTIPDIIYNVAYPAWLLSEEKVMDFFESYNYKTIMTWFSTLENEEKQWIMLLDEMTKIYSKGALLEKQQG